MHKTDEEIKAAILGVDVSSLLLAYYSSMYLGDKHEND